MLVSILLHVIVFFALDQVKFALGIKDTGIRETQPVVIRQPTDEVPYEPIAQAPREDFTLPPPNPGKLLDDLDLQQNLKDQEIDINPQIDKAVYNLEMRSALLAGDPEGIKLEANTGLNIATDLPDPGRTEAELRPADVGQITVDPGSSKGDDSELTRFTQEAVRKGADGTAEKGSIDGTANLDDLIGMNSNQLMGAKTMLPSDFLFEFNRYELRESAKFSLQKLGLLIDTNPGMYCWIEGHTDLIGGDAANLELSKKRAEAVKNYLVNAMKMDANRITTRGFGEFHPIIPGGDQNQQAPNRRVEIKMRKTPPAEEQIKMTPVPPRAEAIEEMPPARPAPLPVAPPKAVKVMPNPQRAIPVEVVPAPPVTPAPAPRIPKATPINEPAPEMAPRALPIDPERGMAPARALPVEPEPLPAVPRAQPVGE